MSIPAPIGRRGKRRYGLVHKQPDTGSKAYHSEINVTPLVDVCLVLLIIFMLISQLLSRGKAVPLPQTQNHSEAADENQPIASIDERGVMYFDKDEVSDLKALKQRIVRHWRESNAKEQRVYIKADSSLPYKKVYPLIMAVRELEVTSIELGTEEKKE